MSEIVWVYNPVARVLNAGRLENILKRSCACRYIDRVISTYKRLIYSRTSTYGPSLSLSLPPSPLSHSHLSLEIFNVARRAADQWRSDGRQLT